MSTCRTRNCQAALAPDAPNTLPYCPEHLQQAREKRAGARRQQRQEQQEQMTFQKPQASTPSVETMVPDFAALAPFLTLKAAQDGNLPPPNVMQSFLRFANGMGLVQKEAAAQEAAQKQTRKKTKATLQLHETTKASARIDRLSRANRSGSEVLERKTQVAPDGTLTTTERIERKASEATMEASREEYQFRSERQLRVDIVTEEDNLISGISSQVSAAQAQIALDTQKARDPEFLAQRYRWIGWELNQAKGAWGAAQIWQPLYRLGVKPQEDAEDLPLPILTRVWVLAEGYAPPECAIGDDFFGVTEAMIRAKRGSLEFLQPKPVFQKWAKCDFDDGDEALTGLWLPELLMRTYAPYRRLLDGARYFEIDEWAEEVRNAAQKRASMTQGEGLISPDLIREIAQIPDSEKRDRLDIDPVLFAKNPKKALAEPRKPQLCYSTQGGFYESYEQVLRGRTAPAAPNVALSPASALSHAAPALSPAPALAPADESHRIKANCLAELDRMWNKPESFRADLDLLLQKTQNLMTASTQLEGLFSPEQQFIALQQDPRVFLRYFLQGLAQPKGRSSSLRLPLIVSTGDILASASWPTGPDQKEPLFDRKVPWIRCCFGDSVLPLFPEGVWLPALVFIWIGVFGCQCPGGYYMCQCPWRLCFAAYEALDKCLCNGPDASRIAILAEP